MPAPNITLFTPTMNRPEYMIRLLKYYRDIRFAGRICVGDSSDDPQARQIEEAVGELEGQLDVVYQRYPGINGVECVSQLLDSVTTSYAAFAADDDFFVPSALEACIRFLDSNPGYSAAHGLAALLSVEANSAYGQVTGTGFYQQPEVEDDGPLVRLKNLLGDYSVTLFSVHRTETWLKMYQQAPEVTEWRRFGGELLQCSRTVIDGKVKELDCLSLVRQVFDHRNVTDSDPDDIAAPGGQRINMTASGMSDEFEWLTGQDWLPSYTMYRDKISSELAEQEGITVDEAREGVKQAFWPYLLRALGKPAVENGHGSSNWVKSVGGSIAGARKSWRQLKSLLPRDEDRLSLEGLLRSSSHYHESFMPIYRMVTTGSASPVAAGQK